MRPVNNFEEVLAAAQEWAGREHAKLGQTWANGLPYLEHLKAVEAVLVRFGFSDPKNAVHQTLRIAAYTHDLLEDTPVTRDRVRWYLGPEVEVLTWAVTNEEGKNRAERHAKTYPKVAATPFATLLKLADRVANVEASLTVGGRLLGMYQKEHAGFREAPWREGGPEAARLGRRDRPVPPGAPGAPGVAPAPEPEPAPRVEAALLAPAAPAGVPLPQEAWF